jgi:hypothetical protein
MTGFISAEGCFFVDIRNSKTHQIGKQVSLEFSMGQHSRDTQLFESFTKYFGCGKVRVNSSTVDFSVVSFLDNYKKIIPFLNKSPLTGAKLLDYLDFCKVAELIHKKEHLTSEGLIRIIVIRASMNNGLSPELKAAFPNIIPAPRPLIESTEIKDSNRLAGFIDGEGSFLVAIQKSTTKTGLGVSLRFTLTQHSRDEALLKSLVDYLGCGRYYLVSDRDEGYFIVSSFSDIFPPPQACGGGKRLFHSSRSIH